MGLRHAYRRRRLRGRLVLWGGRRYDVQVGSQRDRASVRIRALFGGSTGGFAAMTRNVTSAGRTMADVTLEDLRRAAYGR